MDQNRQGETRVVEETEAQLNSSETEIAMEREKTEDMQMPGLLPKKCGPLSQLWELTWRHLATQVDDMTGQVQKKNAATAVTSTTLETKCHESRQPEEFQSQHCRSYSLLPGALGRSELTETT